MGTAIRDQIQECLMGQQSTGLLANGKADGDESEEYFDHDDYEDDDDDDYYYDEDEYYYDDDGTDNEDDVKIKTAKEEDPHVQGNKEDKKSEIAV